MDCSQAADRFNGWPPTTKGSFLLNTLHIDATSAASKAGEADAAICWSLFSTAYDIDDNHSYSHLSRLLHGSTQLLLLNRRKCTGNTTTFIGEQCTIPYQKNYAVYTNMHVEWKTNQ